MSCDRNRICTSYWVRCEMESRKRRPKSGSPSLQLGAQALIHTNHLNAWSDEHMLPTLPGNLLIHARKKELYSKNAYNPPNSREKKKASELYPKYDGINRMIPNPLLRMFHDIPPIPNLGGRPPTRPRKQGGSNKEWNVVVGGCCCPKV